MATTSNTVQEIEQAIEKLRPEELDELYAWLAQYQPQPIDSRLESDFAAGRLDGTILQALEDEKNGQFRPV